MRCGTQDIGVGTRTHVMMVTAETLGMPMDMVKAEIGDSNYRSAAARAAARHRRR